MEKEILIVKLSTEKFGVAVGGLQGIENYAPIKHVANAPDYMEGLVKIRDDVYPVLDLRMRLGLPATEVTPETKILVLNTNAGKAACVVDEVVEIKVASGEEVQTFPSMIRCRETLYVDCVVKIGEELMLVLDAGHLFYEEECQEVREMSEEK